MIVKKLLCSWGCLLVSGNEMAIASEKIISGDENQFSYNDVQVVSRPFSGKLIGSSIRSSELSSNADACFTLAYLSVFVASQKKDKSNRQVFVPFLTPSSQTKTRTLWMAFKQLWQNLNIHHHARKFDLAYIWEKQKVGEYNG